MHTRRGMLRLGLGGLAGRLAAQQRPPRWTCFYQLSRDALSFYQDPDTGLPNDAGHIHVFSQSHGSGVADPSLADFIHAGGSSFTYAPAFDLHKYTGWYQADEDTLAGWAREFRDAVIAAHADYFAFNELPTTTAGDEQVQSQIALLLAYLNEPDANGVQLRGVLFMTEKPSTPVNWVTPGSAFWEAVDATCDLVVAEHYHSVGFLCLNTDEYLANHYASMWKWLQGSGEPAKARIAERKYTVLHSSRYGPGTNGWQGGNSDVVPLEQFQRYLARCTWLTRNSPGGTERIAFAPISSGARYTALEVHPTILRLLRWHYNQAGLQEETNCVEEDYCHCG